MASSLNNSEKSISRFFDSLDCFCERVALVTESEQMSYAELVSLADRITENLPNRSLMMILCRNDIMTIAGYIGAIRSGIVPIMVNSKVDPQLLKRLYETYRPYAILSPEGLWEGTQLFHNRGAVLIKTDYNELPNLNDELALLLPTSGSTGSPKLVRQTYSNIRSNTESIIKYLGILDTDTAITSLPLNYTYGLSILNTHLCAGAKIFVTEKTYFDSDIWDIFRKYKISSFGAVPYTFEMLKRLSFFRLDLPDLRYITQAGGKLDTELHLEYAEYMRNKGKEFIVMYGATEATARMAYLPGKYSVEKAGSIGFPIPGGRFEIVDMDGNVISEPEKEGELIYYGDNVTPGYAETLDDLAKSDERKGRLETGDMAKFDKDGCYMIVGRKSRFLKIFGNRVNLMDIEQLLKDNGWETACTGQDNKMEIYTVSNDLEGISSYIKDKIKFHSSVFSVYHIDAIPRNESGKVLYKELRNK